AGAADRRGCRQPPRVAKRLDAGQEAADGSPAGDDDGATRPELRGHPRLHATRGGGVEAPVTAAAASLRTDARVIGLVGIAHGLSHFFQLCIPPLFPLLREEFGVSYAALGAVLAVFYAVSGVMQTVAGFLVDRVGARTILLS